MDNEEEPRGADNGNGGGGSHHEEPPFRAAPLLAPPPSRGDSAAVAIGGGFTLVGFRGAVRLLEGPIDDDDGIERRQQGRPGRPPTAVTTIHHLFVKCHDAVQKGDDTQSFPQFVDLLGKHHPQQNDGDGNSGVVLRQLSIVVDWRRLPRDDVDRLFRTVLPHHPTLTYVGISLCGLPSSCWRSLTESLPTTYSDDDSAGVTVSPLSGLGLLGESIHQEPIDDHLDAIVDLLTRNVALSSLRVDAPLTAQQGKRLCQALPHNTNLVALSIHVTEIWPDTLEGVAHSSSLQQVEVRGAFGAYNEHASAASSSSSSLAKTQR